jgi:hypothetical protein
LLGVLKSGETVKLSGVEIEFDKPSTGSLHAIEIDGEIVLVNIRETIPCQADEDKGSSEGVETRA